ncbi:unnamed protein product, partial [Staurois parvus]
VGRTRIKGTSKGPTRTPEPENIGVCRVRGRPECLCGNAWSGETGYRELKGSEETGCIVTAEVLARPDYSECRVQTDQI